MKVLYNKYAFSKQGYMYMMSFNQQKKNRKQFVKKSAHDFRDSNQGTLQLYYRTLAYVHTIGHNTNATCRPAKVCTHFLLDILSAQA